MTAPGVVEMFIGDATYTLTGTPTLKSGSQYDPVTKTFYKIEPMMNVSRRNPETEKRIPVLPSFEVTLRHDPDESGRGSVWELMRQNKPNIAFLFAGQRVVMTEASIQGESSWDATTNEVSGLIIKPKDMDSFEFQERI